MPTPIHSDQAQVVAHNLRRLMAKHRISYDQVVEATGLDARTVRGIARGEKRTHSRTLTRLAEGLGVEADELFVDAATILSAGSARGFDEATNPVVSELVRKHPELFEGWTSREFSELYSRFGHGGQLTPEGAMEAAEAMNLKRAVIDKARTVLETSEGKTLSDFVEFLYQKVTTHKQT